MARATGPTIRATIKGLRLKHPDQIAVTGPVSFVDILPAIRREVDKVICLEAAVDFQAVRLHYRHFPQRSDEDVLDALREADRTSAREAGNG